MKPFDYYSNNPHPYPDMYLHKKRLLAEANARAVTAADREKAIKEIPKIAIDWFRKEVEPYNAHSAGMLAEFWADCRADLGYDQFLDSDGVAALEAHAWDIGHSNGFSEVHCHLVDLVELARRLVESGSRRSCPAPARG